MPENSDSVYIVPTDVTELDPVPANPTLLELSIIAIEGFALELLVMNLVYL